MSQKIDLLTTLALCGALKTKLESIDHPTLAGQKLFEVVNFHEDKNLAEALQQLIIVKKRVCLIVPAGDHYVNAKEGRSMRSVRITSVDLVMADLAYTKGGQDAAFGGANNVGVIAMKDIVVSVLAAAPQLTGLRWCALYPTDGAFLTLSESEEAKTPGRQAFAMNYETPSGELITPLTVAWP